MVALYFQRNNSHRSLRKRFKKIVREISVHLNQPVDEGVSDYLLGKLERKLLEICRRSSLAITICGYFLCKCGNYEMLICIQLL